jgi:spore germination protein YaaH
VLFKENRLGFAGFVGNAILIGLTAIAIPLPATASDTTSRGSTAKPASPAASHDIAPPWIMRQVGDTMASARTGSLTPRETVVPLAPRLRGGPTGASQTEVSTNGLSREVFGFASATNLADPSIGYTTWVFSMLSTVAYFGLHVNATDGSLVQGDTGWNVWHSSAASGLINTAHANGVRVVLSVILQSQAADMCSALDHGATTASQVAAQLIGADGVNIDYEGTNQACPDGVTLRSKLVTFLQTIRAAGVGYLSIDTYASSAEDSGGFFDVASLSPTVDAFFVMDYDLELANGPCSACIGPTSPIGGSPTYAWNVTRSANDYKPWAPQTIIGLPYYGVKGCVQGPNPPPNAPVTSQFGADPYTTIVTYPTDPKITSWIQQRDGLDPVGQEPWASFYSSYASCWREEYWDDALSLGNKYDLVNSYGFRGAGIFTLDYGGGVPELWNQLATKFSTGKSTLVSAPVTISPSSGEVDVFWRGADNALWHRWYTNGWYGPENLGGSLLTDPSVVRTTNGVLDVFWKGTDNALWHRWLVAGIWHGPQSLGYGPLGSGPSAVGQANGNVDVFWRGVDSQLWHAGYAGAWHGPEPMGGSLASDPSPVNSGPGVLDVFWKGADSALWHKWYANGWYGPASLGAGPLGSGPHAVGQSTGTIDVFWQGSDSQLWHEWYVAGWYGPEPLGGSLASDPSPVNSSPGVLDVFWKGVDNALWHKWYVNGWYGPTSLGDGPLGSEPTACGQSNGVVDVFWQGTENGLWHAWFTNAWHGPTRF